MGCFAVKSKVYVLKSPTLCWCTGFHRQAFGQIQKIQGSAYTEKELIEFKGPWQLMSRGEEILFGKSHTITRTKMEVILAVCGSLCAKPSRFCPKQKFVAPRSENSNVLLQDLWELRPFVSI